MGVLKSYTDLEQSKRLAEILPIESADIHYLTYSMYEEYCDEIVYTANLGKPGMYDKCCIPCWSLAVLLSIVPNVSLNNFTDGTWNAMVERNGKMVWADKNNPLDACVELIIKLHDLNLL